MATYNVLDTMAMGKDTAVVLECHYYFVKQGFCEIIYTVCMSVN